jgi:regulator of nonsense transcripts 3
VNISSHICYSALKMSMPGVCSLRVLRVEDIQDLANAVEKAIWEDAKNSFNDPCLVRRPYLEVAIYQKIATPKPRPDPRQGTIEQDPEYQEFMASLEGNQSAPKDNAGEHDQHNLDEAIKEHTRVTTTPLIEYLKEKKANKAKEAASAKSAKHGRNESQGGKTKASDDSKKKSRDSKSKEKDKENEKPKEPVKLLTKKATQEAAEAAKSVANQIATSKTSSDAAPKTRRAGIAAVAKQLQRDLGLSPGSAHRRARMDAAKAEAVTKPDASSSSTTTEKETKDAKEPDNPKAVPTGPKSQSAEGSRRSRGKAKASAAPTPADSGKSKTAEPTAKPTTGPIVLLKKEAIKKQDNTPGGPASPSTATAGPSAPASTANATPPTGPKAVAGKGPNSAKTSTPAQQKKAVAEPTPGATRAFVKHANPSQGVTEALLKQAMEVFGPVTFVEIDKRKGFAYVDFGDDDSLRKAMAASPVAVARGTVQVLERKKEKKPATPAPTLPVANDTTGGDAPAAPAAPATAPSDRPKRGGRGRGRRGGANAATPSASGANDEAQSTVPAPAAQPE